MCLAVPGKILETYLENGLQMARIDYSGVENSVCLESTPEAGKGDWVIVHAGFALQLLNEDEAIATLQTLTELNSHYEADRQKNDPS